MTVRRLVGSIAILAVALVTGDWWWHARRARLPATITVDEVAADLFPALATTVAEQSAADPVRFGTLDPGNRLRGDRPRAAVLAPARARLSQRLELPAGATLAFGIGVAGDKQRDDTRTAVRFSVLVDGRVAWTRTVNPAASRHDRRWFDERVPLGVDTAHTATLDLVTEAVDADTPVAGTPGWSQVRVLRSHAVARQPDAPATPNLLVLLVDTLRADRLGCYGATPSPSPTLDALAARGLVFTQMVAQSSWTLPSVASMFTGLHPRSHGAVGYHGADEPGQMDGAHLADALHTWAEVAQDAGITTIAVAANPLVSRGTNLAQGFETLLELPWDPAGRHWATATEVNDAFLAWLAANRGHRFAAYLHYMEPHDPYTPPPARRPTPPPGLPPAIAEGWVHDVARKVSRGGQPLPAPAIAWLRQLYDAEIRGWDDALATLLAELDATGALANTIVVVVSDHGEEFQEHGRLTHGSHLYEESVRVPLVVVGPGVPMGRRDEPVQGVDVYPTVLALLGLSPPAPTAGVDVRRAPADQTIVSETASGIAPDGQGIVLTAVRADGWKLIRTPALARTELYDLRDDPGERHDRSAGTERATTLLGTLARFEAEAPAPPTGSAAVDPTFHDKLRALGYVQ